MCGVARGRQGYSLVTRRAYIPKIYKLTNEILVKYIDGFIQIAYRLNLKHTLDWICSTSLPGGNQVDGLPPASSLRIMKNQKN